MAGFKDIVGHEQIITHLKNAIRMQKISHAYILNGEKSAGKMMIANAFAMTLQCEMQGNEPCMNCRSCRQAKEQNQLDIIYIQHDKSNTISVDDIRHQLNNDVIIKPYSSKYKIYIVDEAEKMSIQAQNALLKTIEEPPTYAIILLLTTNASAFLPTILSRCITLNLKTVKDDLIEQHLMRQYKIPDYQAKTCVAFAQGNVGKAIRLASSEEFNILKQKAISLMKKLDEMDLYEINDAVKEIAEYKNEAEDYLDLLVLWFRDILYFKSTNNINNLIFKDEAYDIKKQSANTSYAELEEILKALEKTRVQIKANVNFDLVMELLLLTIKEN